MHLFFPLKSPLCLPVLIVFIQSFGSNCANRLEPISNPIVPISPITNGDLPPGNRDDETLWSTSSSTENNALITGRYWNTSQKSGNTFLFDLTTVIDYTFPCGDYEDEQSLDEWRSLTLQVWLPCHNSSSRSAVNGEIFGIEDGQCNAGTETSANCALNKKGDVVRVDVTENHQCQAIKLPMEEEKTMRKAGSKESKDNKPIGYRLIELPVSTQGKIGLRNPKALKWVALQVGAPNGQQAVVNDAQFGQAYLRLRTQSERCHVRCGSNVLCRSKNHCVKECGLECDFEQPCPWTFDPPEGGFRIVSGKEKSGKSGHYAYFGTSKQEEVAVKIVSPYLQRTGPNCKLSFQYRLHGMPKTELLIVLEHLHDPSKTVTEAPMQLAMIPTRNSINSKWTDEIIPIGAIRHPMRIRLEAWLNNQGRGTNPVNFSADSYIDQISLIDCQEELYHPDSCQRGRAREKYRCELNKVCIEWDQLCDMKADCFDGEDENEQLHNCSQVPLGARCTFENGMCGWVNSSEGDFRWVLANASYQQVVERELGHKDFTTDHTYGNATGHFMYAEHGQSDTIVRAYLTSPKFPRTSKAISDPSSPYYNQCRIRFFFRHIGRDWHSLDLHLLTADGTNHRHLLWEADPGVPSVERMDSLRWTRVSAVIPHQDWEYQLQFTALRMALYRGHFGIDDVSMTPQCFIEDGTTKNVPIAYPYNFTSCGAVGARGPNQTHCDHAYNNTAVTVTVVEASPNMRGYQTWRVPMTGQYRILAAGSAGGTLWGDGMRSDLPLVHNYGTEIEAVFNLTENDQLLFLVGQRGESPCQAFKRDPYRTLRFRNKASLLNELCSQKWASSKVKDINSISSIRRRKVRRRRRLLNRQDSSSTKEYRSNSAELPGAGGGGATMIAKLNPGGAGPAEFETLIIAAGGGGAFMGAYNTSMGGLAGGNGVANSRVLQYPALSAIWDNLIIAGGGGGFELTENGVKPLTRIPPAAGRPFSVGLGGGQCPRNGNGMDGTTSWSFEGGFGGGGASCGPGGGGGGGYVGGAGGNFTHGHGGWSYTVPTNRGVRPSWNPGSGYIYIYPCLLPCPTGSTCQFLQSTPICRCSDGTVLEKQSNCPVTPSEPHQPDDKTVSFHQPSFYSDHYLMFTVVIVALVAAIIVAIFLYLIYRHRCIWRRKLDKYKRYNSGVGGGTMPMHQFPGGHNFHAEFNPNYEMFNNGALQELKEIPRNCVTLIRALGQGAFGEVYEGLLSECNGEANNLPIAVKSLPEFATEQAQMDFHMEALIMSKFSHPNIVRFIGVCFEKMPRFIILELLAGGDLKTFLRENRPKCNISTKLTMADLLHMALDVARGCQYLEENHFIHRDIAARNCLLTTKSEDRVVKIADFGMARDIYRADYYRKGGKAMLPVKWMPPEAFLDGIFTTKTDVWSFGVLLWEIFSLGYMPYPGRGNQEVMQLVTAGGRLEAPTGCPAQIYQIMTQCWHTVADQRPRFTTIIERLGYCLQDPDVVNTALPILGRAGGSANTVDTAMMQSSVHSNCFGITSPSTGMSKDIMANDGISAGLSRPEPYSGGLFHAPEPMPTSGTGVSTGVYPPYETPSPDAILPLPKESTDSASDCPTDVLLIQSTTRQADHQSTVGEKGKNVQPPSAFYPASLFTHEVQSDDDVFVAGACDSPKLLIHSTKPVGPV